MGEPAEWVEEQRRRIDELIDEYRVSLHGALDGLSEDEARRRLVPSATTLLGLVKHATFVEGVWFDQAVTGRAPSEIGMASKLQVLRELAQHAGHADILREQILAGRSATS